MSQQSDSKRVLAAVVLIATGVLFLFDMDVLWPLFILVPGLLLLVGGLSGGRDAAPLLIPGMMISGTGGLLFFMNITDYWASWAYAWTLYGVFLGMGLVLMGQRQDNGSLEQTGRGFMFFGLLAFAAFAFFFEVLIGINGGVGRVLWPWLLIGVGLFLLFRNIVRTPGTPVLKPKYKHDDDPIFTGPLVVGSRRRSRLSMQEDDEPKH